MDLLAAGADEEKREAARAIAALADGKRAVLAASGVIRPLAEVLVDAIEKVKVSRKSEWRLDKTWCPTQGPNLVLIDAALGALFLLADEEDRRREMAAAGVIPSLGPLFQTLASCPPPDPSLAMEATTAASASDSGAGVGRSPPPLGLEPRSELDASSCS